MNSHCAKCVFGIILDALHSKYLSDCMWKRYGSFMKNPQNEVKIYHGIIASAMTVPDNLGGGGGLQTTSY